MKAFNQNIDALEHKTEQLIQKWKEAQVLNSTLLKQNKQLELELEAKKIQTDTEELKINPLVESNKTSDLSQIQEALNKQIQRLDLCIKLINIELDGK